MSENHYWHRQSMVLRQQIFDYMKANPFASQRECARALGLTPNTICRHVKALREQQQKEKAQ